MMPFCDELPDRRLCGQLVRQGRALSRPVCGELIVAQFGGRRVKLLSRSTALL